MGRVGQELEPIFSLAETLMEKQGSQYGYTPLTRRARGVVYPQDVEMPDTRICELLGKGDFLQLIVTGSIEHQVVRIHLFTKPLRKGNHGIIFDYNGILTMQTYPITPPNEFALHSSLSPFEVKPEAIETFTKLLALAVRLA